ncbi:MAG: pilus assembly PilX family protein, partial [Stenotrophobium sp.]
MNALPALRNSPRDQSGVTLATALFFLVIITLLGLTAMRAGQIGLKLSRNEESRVNALQSSQSVVDGLLANLATNFPVNSQANYQVSCYPSGLALNAAPFYAPFACATQSILPPVTADNSFTNYSYIQIYREGVNNQPFITGNAIPGAGNTSRVRYARFSVTAGFDRANTGQGVAEVTEGVNLTVPS